MHDACEYWNFLSKSFIVCLHLEVSNRKKHIFYELGLSMWTKEIGKGDIRFLCSKCINDAKCGMELSSNENTAE